LDLHSYGIVLDFATKRGDKNTALQYFNQMLSEGFAPSVVHFTALIKVLRSEELNEIFEDMKDRGVARNESFYLVALGRTKILKGSHSLLQNLWNSLEKEDFPITETLYRTYQHVQQDLDSSLAVLEELRQLGYEPRIREYNATLYLAIQREDASEAVQKILEEMQRYEIKYDNHTINTLMNLAKFDECMDIVEKKENGFTPTLSTFKAIFGRVVSNELELFVALEKALDLSIGVGVWSLAIGAVLRLECWEGDRKSVV